MKKIIILIACTLCVVSLSGFADPAQTRFTFADIKAGQDILTADDNYFNRMSPAEIAIRTLSTTTDKTSKDIRAQYKASVLEWTAAEKDQITQLVADNREKLETIRHLLPAEVTFIKVNKGVEGGLPHTRANAIVLPMTDKPLSATLFYHELFHVLSRNQKKRHHSLYGLIGFQPCDFSGNAATARLNLTNPDVPAEGYYLPVTIDGKAAAIMTFLYANKDAFDPEVQGGFGGHFGFGFLKVTAAEGQCDVALDAKGDFEKSKKTPSQSLWLNWIPTLRLFRQCGNGAAESDQSRCAGGRLLFTCDD